MGKWSLEGELLKVSEKSNLKDALVSLKIIHRSEENISVKVMKDWHKSGSETYSLLFSVSSNDMFSELWMKACTPASFGVQIEQVMTKWVRRMGDIEKWNSVFVPKMYLANDGIIIQEHIPHSLLDVVNVKTVKKIGDQCYSLIRCLSANNFLPTGIWHDLRSRLDDVVLVDFGEDLGEPDFELEGVEVILESFYGFLSSKRSASASMLMDVLVHRHREEE